MPKPKHYRRKVCDCSRPTVGHFVGNDAVCERCWELSNRRVLHHVVPEEMRYIPDEYSVGSLMSSRHDRSL